MRSSMRRRLLVCLALPLAAVLAMPAAAQAVGPDEPVSEERGDRPDTGSPLADALIEAVEEGATGSAEILDELSLPESGGGSLSFDAAGQVTATVTLAGSGRDDTLARLAEIAEVDAVSTLMPVATVRIDPGRIAEAAEIPGVRGIVPALQPFTGRELGARAAGPAQAAPLPVSPAVGNESCGPIPVEADGPLRSAEARKAFGVDGSGVTVGIISDSFARTSWPTSWQDDVASGALPGPGNPCGRTQAVEIISDRLGGGSDEGRAMAQLVHGIAPGAKLLFADPGTSDPAQGSTSDIGAAENIVALAQAGADVIVDDITWPQEAYFQKSFMSAAIEYVKEHYGVAYLTSAGNANGVGSLGASSGAPVSSWQTAQYRPMACPGWVDAGTGADCLDFDPGLPEVAYDTLTIDPDLGWATSMRALASIGEPVFGVTTKYELHFYRDNPGDPVPFQLASIPSLGAIYPGLSGNVSVAPGDRVRMVMVRTEHDPAKPDPAVYLGFVRGGDAIAQREFMGSRELGSSAADRVGETAFGHGGDGSAVSIAAADWADPTALRDYSSLGPSTQIFEPLTLPVLDAVPAERLPEPQLIDAPHAVAVDGTQTTFFGDDWGSGGAPEYRFFGTSAAAPNAAAVLALGKSYAPAMSNAELAEHLLATARGPADGGPANPYAAAGFPDSHVTGTGIVDAYRLLDALPKRPAAPTGFFATEITQDSAELRWDEDDAPQHRLEVRDAESGKTLVAEDLDGAASSRTVADLTPNHPYSASLEALNEAGPSWPVGAEFITLPLPPTGLAVARATDGEIELVWQQEGTLDHYRLSIVPHRAASNGSAGSAPPSAALSPAQTGEVVELTAGTTSHVFAGLDAETRHTVILEALNANWQGGSVQIEADTLAAQPVLVSTRTLPPTGGQSGAPVLIGAGALIVLGAAVTAITLVRRRGAGDRNDESQS
jgi:hypothetical protein